MPSHTTVWNAPIHGKATHNSWYDTRRHLQWEVTRGIYTHKQARTNIQWLVRRKKRSNLAKFEAKVYWFLRQVDRWHYWAALPPRPTWIHVFSPLKIRNTIDRLQFGKAQDHDGLIGEHFIYVCTSLKELYVKVSFPTCWTEHTIVLIFKSGDPMVSNNYRTIMIGHFSAKLPILIPDPNCVYG